MLNQAAGSADSEVHTKPTAEEDTGRAAFHAAHARHRASGEARSP